MVRRIRSDGFERLVLGVKPAIENERGQLCLLFQTFIQLVLLFTPDYSKDRESDD